MNFVIRLITVKLMILFSASYINADNAKASSKNCCKDCCKCGSCGGKKSDISKTSDPKKGFDPTKGEKPKGPGSILTDQKEIEKFQKNIPAISPEIMNQMTSILKKKKDSLMQESNPAVIENVEEKKDSHAGTLKNVLENRRDPIRKVYPYGGPHIGLQNIGATCYMNATLQCFCHNEKFVDFFRCNTDNKTREALGDSENLSSSFKTLIDNLWTGNYDPNNPKFYQPYDFKNKISKMNPLFEGIAANDAKDLVNFIIMTLHQELNKVKVSNVNINNNNTLDQRNQQIMFNNFAQNFVNENQSIISDLFYGMNCNITQCCNCNSSIFNYQIYFFLVFPLEEVRKFKNNNIFNNPLYFNNQLNIYDCFDYDRKVNFMCGENSMYCNYCKQNTNCKMCTRLSIGPETLILLLNRGHGIEFNIRINFMEDLDLSYYIEYNNTGCKYKLTGVITHLGESSMSGHFIAYCKDPINGKWYKYNDAIVGEVNDFKKEVIDFGMPYLLFYQKVDVPK